MTPLWCWKTPGIEMAESMRLVWVCLACGDMHQCVGVGWLCHCPTIVPFPLLRSMASAELSLFITALYCICVAIVFVFVLYLSPVPWFSLCPAFSYISISRPTAHCISTMKVLRQYRIHSVLFSGSRKACHCHRGEMVLDCFFICELLNCYCSIV